MACGCKKKKQEPTPTPVPTPVPIKPQTVEEFHAQEMNKWGGGVNIINNA